MIQLIPVECEVFVLISTIWQDRLWSFKLRSLLPTNECVQRMFYIKVRLWHSYQIRTQSPEKKSHLETITKRISFEKISKNSLKHLTLDKSLLDFEYLDLKHHNQYCHNQQITIRSIAISVLQCTFCSPNQFI